ncbi:TraB/GumN family protein [Phenylobacterium sp.]|uniref:TraB/GumN family protein n=1 Tax=Phenylobacterium sp. TaxID=1871053 RepID=UPI0027310AA1|nr:TraB/GumN family protein [Phenylobacterium sp.]MDP2214311.1 TraB/GumN family protein [Phenylobacterium sp.]
MRLTALVCGLLLLATPLVGAAQTPDSLPQDPDAVLVEELVVTAREIGPAWWRVSDGDSTVYVMGVPSVIPKGSGWDASVLERRLEGANRVILPFNNASVNLLTAPGAVVSLVRLRSSSPFEESLGEPLRARFVAARTQAGQGADRYKTRNGMAAALLLVSDYRDAARLTAADPAKTIGRMAAARGIRVEAKTYDAAPLLAAVVRTPAEAQRACVLEALAAVEAGPGSAQAAARAWAWGQVREALGGERSYERCIAAAPGAADLDARLKADQTASIVAALRQPGHSIAVVQLRPLLAQGGVLDRLGALGYEIRTPAED